MKKSKGPPRPKKRAAAQNLGPPREPSSASGAFPIVGIGASAGGLEAFSELLRHLPEKSGMAFVLVQHLDPTHGSALQEILARITKIPVAEVTDDVKVQPDHIYVIPANTNMILEKGALRLAPRELTRGQHLPVDHFFNSLAADRGDQAVGVILSGTASDGTLGCAAIKAAGGITFAQDEKSAKYTSMPRSAVHAGNIDFVLPPKGIARELTRLHSHPLVHRIQRAPEPRVVTGGKDMDALFALVREASGVDFTNYKQSTLQRRIKRRIILHRLENLKQYLRYIRRNPGELDELYRDILIHVTAFFRDPEAFEALQRVVFPGILTGRKPADGPIRIWVPGCSTGEEVYSIAIVLLEFLWEQSRANPALAADTKAVQIFASDISDVSLDRARNGLYGEAALTEVSAERLKRFFVRIDGGYQINKSVREMCIFARQDIVKDPPFSNLDLVSCRNLLIYLGPVLQKRVIPTFHYALKPNGYLMLGSSESLGAFADHFTLVEKKFKVYQKKRGAARLVTYFTGGDYGARKPAYPSVRKAPSVAITVEKDVERALADRYVPASIVVNEEMEIVQFRGKTGPYLEPAPGYPTFSLSKMVREGLLVDLRDALAKARKSKAPIRKERVRIASNGGSRAVDFEVIPIQGQDSERFYVVAFQEHPERHPSQKHPALSARERRTSESRENNRTRQEITHLRDQLQRLIEDHETTLEEFKSANEEVLSANEELQSTNEELETAKEELQSTNEELTTLNEELQNRNTELTVANNDLLNLFANVNVPVVMVAGDLRIRRFTPAAQKLMNFLPADVGRRLGEIRTNITLDHGDLEHIVRETVDTATMQERQVRERDGSWFSVRVRPYKTWDNKIDGAVLTFQDIDIMKRDLDQSRHYADALIDSAREPILVLDQKLRVAVANPAFYRLFQVSPKDTENQLIYDLGNKQWQIPKLRTLFEELLKSNTRIDDFEVTHDFPGLGTRQMLLNARRVGSETLTQFILLAIEDVTEQRVQLESLRHLSAYLMRLQDEERRRIARDLHDSAGQKLAGLKMILEQVAKRVTGNAANAKDLRDSVQLTAEAFSEIRTVAQLLHPPELDTMGLEPAMTELARGFAQRSGIAVDVDIPQGFKRLPLDTETALFRVLQECLSNILRHSGAKKATVRLAPLDGSVSLEVNDDGKGMGDRPKAVDGKPAIGVGILGMKERLAQLNGTLEVVSRATGTTITAVVPRSPTKD